MSVALHHVVDGPEDAPAILLGNSLGADVGMWDEVTERLVPRFRVVRFDHRGQGASPVPPGPYEIADLGGDVVALLDALGLDRVGYAGDSIGGMVGLWLAAHAPERLQAAAVFCTTAHFGDDEPYTERARIVRAAGGTEPVADAVVSRWLTPAFAAEHPEIVARLRAMVLASPLDGYVACCGALARLDLRDDLPGIAVPLLVVSGEHDAAIPPDHGRRIADAVPGARFELVDAAHIPMVERPDAVTALIAEHLEVART